MTWPSGNISLANLDSGSDSISSARADLYEAVNKVNLMIDNGPTAEGGGSYVDITTTQTISGNKTFTGNVVLNEYQEYVYNIGTTSGSVTPNWSNGPVQTITLNGNLTLNTPVNMSAGASVVLIIRQDATGLRTLTANSAYKFQAGMKTLSTAGSAIDILSIFYDSTNYLCSLAKGYS